MAYYSVEFADGSEALPSWTLSANMTSVFVMTSPGDGGGNGVDHRSETAADPAINTTYELAEDTTGRDVGKALLLAFLTALTVITILGNTLVILAVATTRRLRSVTNCFIVSLSVSDLLVGCLVMPLSLIAETLGYWPFGQIMCELWSSLDIMLCTASILNLSCISLDRYFAITRPLTYTVKRNKRMALGMIGVVWLASVAVTCPPLLGWYQRDPDEGSGSGGTGSESPPPEKKPNPGPCQLVSDKGYVIYSACGSFYIPLAVMLFVYTRIFVVIYRRNRVVKQQKQYQKQAYSAAGTSGVTCPHGCASAPASCNAGAAPSGNPDGSGKCSDCSGSRATLSVFKSAATRLNSRAASHGGRQQPTSPHYQNHLHPLDRYNSDTTGDLRPSNSDYYVGGGRLRHEHAVSMASDSMLTVMHGRPRCGSSTTMPKLTADLARTATSSSGAPSSGRKYKTTSANFGECNGLFRSRSYQFHFHPTSGALTGSKPGSVATPGITLTSSSTNVLSSLTGCDNETKIGTTKRTPTTTVVVAVPVSSTTTMATTATTTGLGALQQMASAVSARSLSTATTNSSLLVPTNHDISGGPPTSVRQAKLSLPCLGNLPSGEHLTLLTRHNGGTATTTITNSNSSCGGRSGLLSGCNGTGNKDFRRKNQHQSRGLRMSFRKETKATTTIAVVVGGFVVCWMPFFLAYIVEPFCPSCHFPRFLMSSLTWLGWANSAINPCIYAFYNMDFRAAFWRLTLGHCLKDTAKAKTGNALYPQVWRSKMKAASAPSCNGGVPSIVMVQSDLI